MDNRINALDINASCFAFASAGSGKTKLLVDRYIKSLITGIQPSEILCLTFTNLAVSEMFNRISSILKDLHIQNDEYIKDYLTNTLGIYNISENLIQNVKNLFTNFQNELQDTKIMTIHSFCKEILNQFPVEADVSVGFDIIEQEELNALLYKAKKNYFNKPTYDKSIPFSKYYISELIDEIFSNTANYFSIYNKDSNNILYEKLKSEDIQFTDNQQYVINEYFSNRNLEEVFLTKTGNIRKNIRCKEVDNKILNDIANTVYEMKINNNKKNIIFKTKIFIEIIQEIHNELNRLKSNNNVLDFNDIINKTYYLLKYSSYKDYVLLEIAKNIKTILLDEAQDLSTIQWAILGFFIENCFADILNNKSVFIVGDIKQSIYRFQNANYKAFLDFYSYSQNANKQFNKKLYTVYLDKCYRTLPNILLNIDKVFCQYSQFAFNNTYRNHIPVRKGEGIFELVNTKTPQEIAQYIHDKNIKDALILFRSRNEFNTNLYYELLNFGLNIAPLDKLYLKDIPIIQNIILLADIAINSIDNNINNVDRSLVYVLQSNYVFDNPVNNQELFNICNENQKSLSENIKEKYIDKFNIIKSIIDLYKSNNLLEFVYYISYKIIKINNLNDNNVLATFMDIVEQYSEDYNENIIDFIEYFNNNEYTMHSYNNDNKECIRFSSIHSAKGLEASTVILLNFNLKSDKNQLKFIYKNKQNIFEPYNNEYLFLLKPSLNETCNEVEDYVDEEYTEESKELFRLLYVALTRAKNKLYIFNNGSETDDNSVFNIIQKSL